MAQQENNAQDMELTGMLLYQLKMEVTSLATAIVESANDVVRSELTEILNMSLTDQKIVFDLMNQRGWYKLEPAPQDQYQRVQQTFETLQQATNIT